MAVLTDDGTVWPEDQPAAPPAPANPPADPYGGYWIPRILANMWRTAVSGATLPGDVATGQASMSDPATQARVNDLTTLSMLAPGAAPAEAGALNEGLRRSNAVAPAVIANSQPTSADVTAIMSRAADLRKGAWPQTQESLFDTSPEGYARTTSIVPQNSIRDIIPSPAPGQPLPLGERAAPIVSESARIASAIADRLYPMTQTQDPRLMFYNTGPIYEKLAEQGIDPAPIMRDWSGQVAATSPRTQTPPNLRNASLLLFSRGEGPGANPLTFERWSAEGNAPGYGMMGEQVKSANRFWENTASPDTAPKQFTFRGNVQGNLASPTIDTHNIRASLYQFDQLHPGQLPRQWFTSDDAYNAYRSGRGFPSETEISPEAINDSLGGSSRGGVNRQTEYGPMTTPWYDAAEQLGISPAQAQAGGWFSYGNVTGLRSPVRSLTQLLNDQLYDTARTIGVPPERVLDWWARKLIPLTQNEAPAGPQQTQIG
jgi:hypothetical protein